MLYFLGTLYPRTQDRDTVSPPEIIMSANNRMLRKTVLARRDTLTAVERDEKSKLIIANLTTLPLIQQASDFLVYVDFRSEVRTVSFITQCLQINKNVSVPLTGVTEKTLQAIKITDVVNDLKPGYCGIPEPIPGIRQTAVTDPSGIDVVIVPGSVFDRQGGRLGYGGGYYDRFLALSAPQAKRIGLAFELQVVDAIQLQPHDQKMDWLITEKKIYAFERG